ncbi:MAG: hypothetical protein RL331_1122 [Bacteroidota bacterium]
MGQILDFHVLIGWKQCLTLDILIEKKNLMSPSGRVMKNNILNNICCNI